MAMVTIYSRHGCHLCEDAVKILESLREELAFEIEIISISMESQNLRSYTENRFQLLKSMASIMISGE
jgi:glutaredoxin